MTRKKVEALESMLHVDVPKLLQLIPDEAAAVQETEMSQIGTQASPFAVMKIGGANETTVYQNQWLSPPNADDYAAEFSALGPNEYGKITGHQAKTKLMQSKLPSTVLHKIWTLADVDKDGALSLPEYALAMHFVKMRLDGQDLPIALPENMIPELR